MEDPEKRAAAWQKVVDSKYIPGGEYIEKVMPATSFPLSFPSSTPFPSSLESCLVCPDFPTITCPLHLSISCCWRGKGWVDDEEEKKPGFFGKLFGKK